MSPGYRPDWPLPANVRAFVTYRRGGASQGPYAGNNLSDGVGDQPGAVARNRRALQRQLRLDELRWLNQVHGRELVDAAAVVSGIEADGSFTQAPGLACTVLSADCLPLLICDGRGEQVAAVHGGWRGLAAGIVYRALERFRAPASALMVYLGPAISRRHYEVDQPVRDALAASVSIDPGTFARAVPGNPGHFRLDLFAVARGQLKQAGVRNIYGGDRCAYSEANQFYSYRRDGVTGRMASLIWRV